MVTRHRYSLWPEQARSRRGGSLKFAAGSFVLGVALAAAAYGVVSNYGGPAATQRPAAERKADRVPVYASVPEPARPPAPAQVGGENRGSRARMGAAKTTLPTIGSQTEALPLTATGGADSEKLAGEAPEADMAASADRPSIPARRAYEPGRRPQADAASSDEAKAPAANAEGRGKPRRTIVEKTIEAPARSARDARDAREVSAPVREPLVRDATSDDAKPAANAEGRGKPRKIIAEKTPEATAHPVREAGNAHDGSGRVREPLVREAKSDEAKPAAVTERCAKPSRNAVQKKQEGSASRIARHRQKHEEPTRPAKRRPDRSSSTVMEAALRALRLVTEGQDLLGM
jgi:hypothetical protein